MCGGKFNSEYLYIKIKLFINMENENKLRSFIKTTLREFLNEQKLNEISSDTFKSAINVSKERDLIGRTENLGDLYFHEFIGKPIFEDGVIKSIKIAAYKSMAKRLVAINVEYSNKNQIYHNDDQSFPKQNTIWYDIDSDIYNNVDFKIQRKDAFLLWKIAQKINPDTKYKETGKYFNIKGW